MPGVKGVDPVFGLVELIQIGSVEHGFEPRIGRIDAL
jgi:hypothetical protein